MKLQKIIAVSTIVTFLPIYYAFADLDIQTANQLITSLQNTVSKYAETIKQLQDENAKLKSQIAGVTSTTVASSTVSNVASTGTVAIITPSTISSVDKYNKLIDKINFMSEEIFASNNLSKTSSI
jgi:cell division septum initiation protein DivIVA